MLILTIFFDFMRKLHLYCVEIIDWRSNDSWEVEARQIDSWSI